MSRSYPPEFRRKVLDLVASGRPIKQVAEMLGISDQTIYNWRRQHLIDTGQAPGIPSSENAELIAARRRIAELENELAVHRRAAAIAGRLQHLGFNQKRLGFERARIRPGMSLTVSRFAFARHLSPSLPKPPRMSRRPR